MAGIRPVWIGRVLDSDGAPSVNAALDAGRRERSKAANRQAILDAARRVFAELGYDATSVRDIIRGTELASGTFYNYFKSKEEVFEALQDDSARRFRAVLRAQCEHATTLDSLVRGALRAYLWFIAGEHAVNATGAVKSAPPPIRIDTPEIKAVFEEVRVQVEGAIARGLAPPLDADYLAAAAIGVAREVGDRMLLRGGGDIDGAAAFGAAFILAGVTGAASVR